MTCGQEPGQLGVRSWSATSKGCARTPGRNSRGYARVGALYRARSAHTPHPNSGYRQGAQRAGDAKHAPAVAGLAGVLGAVLFVHEVLDMAFRIEHFSR